MSGQSIDTLSENQIQVVTDYLWEHKRIPEILPSDLKRESKDVPEMFQPNKTICPYCPGPTPPELSEPRVVTSDTSIYGLLSVQRSV